MKGKYNMPTTEPLASKYVCNVMLMTTPLMKKLFPTGKRVSIFGIVNIPCTRLSKVGILGNVSLILEDIQDPGNLGTMLRCAEAFGVKSVVYIGTDIPLAIGRLFSRITIRASMGAIFRLNLSISSVRAALQYCDTYAIEILASTPHTTLTLADWCNAHKASPSRIAVALGNENSGLSHDFLSKSRNCVRIQMLGLVESINVAVSCGILLHALIDFQ
mmetsp:Transcript_17281/g.25911  ORF Transcript_17281/g.25911 Transcript_17281/m.25911 type:complete len:217 (+) Transcript_17281:417-1067(+)